MSLLFVVVYSHSASVFTGLDMIGRSVTHLHSERKMSISGVACESGLRNRSSNSFSCHENADMVGLVLPNILINRFMFFASCH